MVNSSEPGNSKPVKKNSKTLIVLIVIAAIIVFALCGVLAAQFLMPQPSSSGGDKEGSNSTISEPDKDSSSAANTDSANVSPASTNSATTLSCTKVVKTETTESSSEEAVSSTVKVSAKFADGKLSTISSEKISSTTSPDAEALPEKKEIVASEITATNAKDYNLPVDESGNVDLTLAGIRKNYELLDFVCEAL